MPTFDEVTGALGALLRSCRNYTSTERLRAGVAYGSARRVYEAAKRGQRGEVPWTPFERVNPIVTATTVEALAAKAGCTPEEAAEALAARAAKVRWFANSRFQVQVHDQGDVLYLSIKRLDQEPVRNWRDLQRIKNELVGPEHEGIELFPAESRLNDEANQYHLFVLKDPSARIPVGAPDRVVAGPDPEGVAGQEPFEEMPA